MDVILSGKVNRINSSLGNEYLASVSDVTSYFGTVQIFPKGDFYVTRTAGTNCWYMFPSAVTKIIFTILDGEFVCLGGNGTTITAINFTNSTPRILADITNAGSTNNQYITATKGNVGDQVSVEVINSNTYKFQIKRRGTETFVDWFTLNKSDYPTVTGWAGNSTLGLVGASTNYSLVHDVILQKPGYTPTLNSSVAKKSIDLDINRKYYRSKWYNKYWFAIGDSQTYRDVYTQRTAAQLEIGTMVNYGYSGLSMSQIYGNRASWASYTDLISVFAGTNDLGQNTPLGVKGDSTTSTFYGSLKLMIEYLINTFPGVTIFFITPPQRWGYTGDTPQCTTMTNSSGITLLQYVDAIKDMCQDYGVPVLDLYRNLGVNQLNINTWTVDGLHFNTNGYAKIAGQVAAFANSLS